MGSNNSKPVASDKGEDNSMSSKRNAQNPTTTATEEISPKRLKFDRHAGKSSFDEGGPRPESMSSHSYGQGGTLANNQNQTVTVSRPGATNNPFSSPGREEVKNKHFGHFVSKLSRAALDSGSDLGKVVKMGLMSNQVEGEEFEREVESDPLMAGPPIAEAGDAVTLTPTRLTGG